MKKPKNISGTQQKVKTIAVATMQPVTVTKKKRTISPEIQKKGATALAKWRAEKAAAHKKGGKALEKWLAEQAQKKAEKNLTPMQAIKNFCNDCVGGIKMDIRNCTAPKCSLYIYRPYQTGNIEE